MRLATIGSLVISAAIVLFFSLQPDPNVTGSEAASPSPLQNQAAEVPTKAIWGPSPFEIGTIQGLTGAQDQKVIAARRRQMASSGYHTPEEYDHMGVKELRTRADNGDPSALLQLGERYWSEPTTMAADPDAEMTGDARNLAVQYFIKASRGGAVQVTQVVAQRIFESGDVAEAAARNMVAQQVGQPLSNGAAATAFGRLSYEQLLAAQKRAQEIALQMNVVMR